MRSSKMKVLRELEEGEPLLGLWTLEDNPVVFGDLPRSGAIACTAVGYPLFQLMP